MSRLYLELHTQRSMGIYGYVWVVRPVHIVVPYYLIEACSSAWLPSLRVLASRSPSRAAEYSVLLRLETRRAEKTSWRLVAVWKPCWKGQPLRGVQTEREDSGGRRCEPSWVVPVEGHRLWKRAPAKKNKKRPLWEDPWSQAGVFWEASVQKPGTFHY